MMKLYSTKEAAVLVGCSESLVRKYAKKYGIPVYKGSYEFTQMQLHKFKKWLEREVRLVSKSPATGSGA